MDLKLIVLLGIAGLILQNLLLRDLHACLPRIQKFLLRIAVKALPPHRRNEAFEKWDSDLSQLWPSEIWRTLVALDCIRGACVLRIEYKLRQPKIVQSRQHLLPSEVVGHSDIFAAEYNEIDGLLAGLSDQYQSFVKDLRAAEAQRRPKSYFEDAVRDVLPSAAEMELLDKHPNAQDLQRAMSAVGKFGETAIRASKRAWELLDVSLVKINDQLDHVGGLIQTASDKLCQARDLLRRGDVSSGALETLTKSMRGDLEIIKSIIAVDNWGDDAAMQAHDNIMAQFETTVENLRAVIQRTSGQLSADARGSMPGTVI